MAERKVVCFILCASGIGLAAGAGFGYAVNSQRFQPRSSMQSIFAPFLHTGLNFFNNLQSRVNLPRASTKPIIQKTIIQQPSNANNRVVARKPIPRPTKPLVRLPKTEAPNISLSPKTSGQPAPKNPSGFPFASIISTFLRPFHKQINSFTPQNFKLSGKVMLPSGAKPQSEPSTPLPGNANPKREYMFITYLNQSKTNSSSPPVATNNCEPVYLTHTVTQTVVSTSVLEKVRTVTIQQTQNPSSPQPLYSSTPLINKQSSESLYSETVSPTTPYPPTSDLLTTEGFLSTTEQQMLKQAVAQRLARYGRNTNKALSSGLVRASLRIKDTKLSKKQTQATKSKGALKKIIYNDNYN